MIEIRAQQVIIDQPRKDSMPFVNIVVQRIIYNEDGSINQIIDRERTINKPLLEFASELYHFEEMFPVSSNEISGYGLASAIRGAVVGWLLKEYQDFELINGQVVKDASN